MGALLREKRQLYNKVHLFHAKRQRGSALTEFQPFCLLAHSYATRGEGSSLGYSQCEITLCDSNNDDNILQKQERMIYVTLLKY